MALVRRDPSRLYLSDEQLARLPIISVLTEEAYELMCFWDFNPTCFYEDQVDLVPSEIGQNRYCRMRLSTVGL